VRASFNQSIVLLVVVVSVATLCSFYDSSPAEGGCHLYGKIKFVDYGEDYSVKFVDYGEDLRIKYVSYGENSVGLWKVVEYGEDYKVKIVDYGEDYSVKDVDYGEGCN
tara:strand:- start:204 stop:527 length:324 start_codon:yes stop_codon:yes gene_type:complete